MSVEMGTTFLPVFLVGGLLMCLHSYLVLGFSLKCGGCVEECDVATSSCVGGCAQGWKGSGCRTRCRNSAECFNPCKCERACACEAQSLKCDNTLCSSPEVDIGTSGSDIVDSGARKGMVIIIVSLPIAVICIAVGTAAYFRGRSKFRRGHLRGRLLGMRCFAYCPNCRDWLLQTGAKHGLSGFQPGAKDSVDDLKDDDEIDAKDQAMAFRIWRRQNATVVGVKLDMPNPILLSAASGYRWKRKWRYRKETSKKKRKMRHEQRKLRKLGIEPKRGSIVLPPPSGARYPSIHSHPSPRRGSTIPRSFGTMFRRGSTLPKRNKTNWRAGAGAPNALAPGKTPTREEDSSIWQDRRENTQSPTDPSPQPRKQEQDRAVSGPSVPGSSTVASTVASKFVIPKVVVDGQSVAEHSTDSDVSNTNK